MTLDVLRMQRRLQDAGASDERGSIHSEMVGLWRTWYDLKATIIIGLMGVAIAILLGFIGILLALVFSCVRLASALG